MLFVSYRWRINLQDGCPNLRRYAVLFLFHLSALTLSTFPRFKLKLKGSNSSTCDPPSMSALAGIIIHALLFCSTDTQDLGSSSALRTQSNRRSSSCTSASSLVTCCLSAFFPSPNATQKVKSVLKTLSTDGPKENLRKFTSFRTRCMLYFLHILSPACLG